MPPKRGRPPLVRPLAPVVSDPSNPYQALYPPDLTKVECCLCQESIGSIASHLLQKHPTVRREEYSEMFPSAPLVGEIDQVKEPDRAVTVSKDEVEAHPGGREAALIEKTLDSRERSAYRADVESLLGQGHAPSHQVASVAYLMTLSRRVRLRIEQTRDITKGEVFHSEALETFYDLEAKIGKGIADLEKIRAQRVEEAGEDPLAVVEQELEAAELFIQSRIGEHLSRCPGCGQMLTVPELPHWAYEPLQTDQGLLWPVWSPEMWKLVLGGEMRLSVMAFALRTSPEGLKYTAARRGEPWPDDLDLGAAEAELRVRLLDDERVKALPVHAVVDDGGSIE